MKVILDRARCTGIGLCESLSPDHFEVGETGELELLRSDVTPAERPALEAAVQACPTSALTLTPTTDPGGSSPRP